MICALLLIFNSKFAVVLWSVVACSMIPRKHRARQPLQEGFTAFPKGSPPPFSHAGAMYGPTFPGYAQHGLPSCSLQHNSQTLARQDSGGKVRPKGPLSIAKVPAQTSGSMGSVLAT